MAKPVQRKKQQQKQVQPAQETSKKVVVEKQELNPKTTRYEFGGPIGALGMVVGLPILVLFFATCCDETGYPSQAFMKDWKSTLLSKFTIDFMKSLYDPEAFLFYVAFVAVLAGLYFILPADVSPGAPLRNGERLRYRLNGKPPLVKTKRSLPYIPCRFCLFPCYIFHFPLLLEGPWIETFGICL